MLVNLERSPIARVCPCRLFAVNHAIAAASSLDISVAAFWGVLPFVQNALAAELGDAPENLVQPGGANYDWSVLHHNLQLAGLASHPLPPEALETRLTAPFARHREFEIGLESTP